VHWHSRATGALAKLNNPKSKHFRDTKPLG
jgi:hypothetical protein